MSHAEKHEAEALRLLDAGHVDGRTWEVLVTTEATDSGATDRVRAVYDAFIAAAGSRPNAKIADITCAAEPDRMGGAMLPAAHQTASMQLRAAN